MDFMNENYYTETPWDVEKNICRAYEVLDSFDPEKPPRDISHIMELYSLNMLLDGKSKYSKMINTNKYSGVGKRLMECVAKFFKSIDSESIKTYADDCYHEFRKDFWELVFKFRVYNKIDKFPWVAEKCGLPLYEILRHRDVVKDIELDLCQFMRESDQTATTLIDYYLSRHENNTKLFIPESFSKEDRKKIVIDYITGDDINANVLTLIVEAPKNMSEIPIDDRMKIMAEKRITDIFDGKTKNVIIHTRSTGLGVEFSENVPDTVEYHKDNDKIIVKYDVNWIKENLDYPTLLNNFIYLFGFVDLYMRWQISEKASDRGTFEDIFLVKGVKSYITGQSFKFVNRLSNIQMTGYYETLFKLGVALEDVIKWFFEEYLNNEFQASGFVCNMPKSTDTYLTKCKMIVSTMDGVAKQYRMYVEDGKIDRELYERSSEHMHFEELGSFQSCKYIYCKANSMFEAQQLLFSDQSHIAYTSKTKSKYNIFSRLITSEDMHKSDFYDYQWNEILKLIALDVVRLDGDIIRLNVPVVDLLYEFYSQEVICYQYRKNDILDTWIREGLVEIGATLFSKNESSYINYMLNQSEFSNGFDLRNKYSHDTCPLDENIQKQDYFEIFKIMILMVIKINEEFCLKSEK